MKNLFQDRRVKFSFLVMLMGWFGPITAHNHTTVVVENGHGHYYHPHERVYVSHPWYHHDHVVIHDGYYYPAYYAGYPYYYYTPQYYYYSGDPALSVNVNIGG